MNCFKQTQLWFAPPIPIMTLVGLAAPPHAVANVASAESSVLKGASVMKAFSFPVILVSARKTADASTKGPITRSD